MLPSYTYGTLDEQSRMTDQPDNPAAGEAPQEPERADASRGGASGPSPAAGPGASSGEGWERELLTRLAYASLVEQRRTRRWGMVFRLGILAYLVLLLVLYSPGDWWPDDSGQHTALVDIRGIISDGSDASADRVVAGLRAAFEDTDTVGVILRINSPGGSPVQSAYIHDEMRRLREEHPETPLYAVIGDMAASGGYFVAAAADKIYANQSSIVGSIGVLMNGFGFVDAMDKLGVERRLLTAGRHKGLLDPFSPSVPEEVAHIETVLDEIHDHFIQAVREGRGDRLAEDERLFTGLIWSGEEGVELGLVDEFGSSGEVARDVIGEETIKDFTPRRGVLDRIAGRVGTALADGLADALLGQRSPLR